MESHWKEKVAGVVSPGKTTFPGRCDSKVRYGTQLGYVAEIIHKLICSTNNRASTLCQALSQGPGYSGDKTQTAPVLKTLTVWWRKTTSEPLTNDLRDAYVLGQKESIVIGWGQLGGGAAPGDGPSRELASD